MGSWSLYQARSKTKANPQSDSFETMKEKWGETIRTFNPETKAPANGFASTSMLNFFSAALKHEIPDVFTNSNQKGFPAGD